MKNMLSLFIKQAALLAMMSFSMAGMNNVLDGIMYNKMIEIFIISIFPVIPWAILSTDIRRYHKIL